MQETVSVLEREIVFSVELIIVVLVLCNEMSSQDSLSFRSERKKSPALHKSNAGVFGSLESAGYLGVVGLFGILSFFSGTAARRGGTRLMVCVWAQPRVRIRVLW